MKDWVAKKAANGQINAALAQLINNLSGQIPNYAELQPALEGVNTIKHVLDIATKNEGSRQEKLHRIEEQAYLQNSYLANYETLKTTYAKEKNDYEITLQLLSQHCTWLKESERIPRTRDFLNKTKEHYAAVYGAKIANSDDVDADVK